MNNPKKQLSHMRLASNSLGDDCTLTRYVRVGRGDERPRKHQPRIPGLAPAFVEEGRTKFRKSVKAVSEMTTLLVSGHSNVKIGRDVRKGHLKGYWIYTLSLEERKTCPSSCHHWQTCYGNNMPFAKRVRHDDPEFLPRLEAELADLLATRGRRGILVRLHALGDFYSEEYVAFWERMLQQHPNLALYGYTARNPFSDIGLAVHTLFLRYGKRAMIRFSDYNGAQLSTTSIVGVESRPSNAFVCPEQTGQTRCCATCGACWGTTKNVAFLAH